MVEPVAEPDQAQDFLRAALALRLGEMGGTVVEGNQDVIQRARAGEEIEILKNETDPRVAGQRAFVRGHSGEFLSVEPGIGYRRSGWSRHPRMFINVLLPEPLAPTNATSSPRVIFSVTP